MIAGPVEIHCTIPLGLLLILPAKTGVTSETLRIWRCLYFCAGDHGLWRCACVFTCICLQVTEAYEEYNYSRVVNLVEAFNSNWVSAFHAHITKDR